MLVWHLFRHFIFSKRAGALIKRISWLSLIGISISVTALLVVLFVMNGMNASIRKRMLGLEPHLYVQVAGVTSAEVMESLPVFQRIKENPDDRGYVYESQDVIIRTQDGQFRGGIARGVSKQSLQHFIEQLQKMERKAQDRETPTYYWDPEDVPGKGELIMGVDLAHSLGVFEGDYVTVVAPSGLLLPQGETPKFERVRIKRIVTTSLADIDAQYVFYQRGDALNSLVNEGMRKLGIEVWLSDESRVDEVKEDLQKFSDVSVETWMDRNSALLYALKLEKLTIGTFLALAGMIAGSSILTVLALLLSQKKRDIAVLRTIGLSAKQTVKTFTQMGFLLASTGVLVGVFLGTGIGFYLQAHPIMLEGSQIYYDPSIPALVDYGLIFGVLVVSGLICWFGSYFPARTASEVEPSDALRMR